MAVFPGVRIGCLPEIAGSGQIHRSENDFCHRSPTAKRTADFHSFPHLLSTFALPLPADRCWPLRSFAPLFWMFRAPWEQKKWKAEKRISHKIGQWVRAQGWGNARVNRFPQARKSTQPQRAVNCREMAREEAWKMRGEHVSGSTRYPGSGELRSGSKWSLCAFPQYSLRNSTVVADLSRSVMT